MFLIALLLSLLLFLASLFFGKLFYHSFKANILHYAVCVIVALITCICFTIIFKMNSGIKTIEKFQKVITLQSSDVLKETQNDAAQKLLKDLKQEHKLIAKLLSAAPAANQLGGAADYVNAIGNQAKNKLKSIRNKAIGVLTVFQLIAFVVVGVAASKSGKSFAAVSYYENSGY
jgi:predicted PurR-regulated permease PerM